MGWPRHARENGEGHQAPQQVRAYVHEMTLWQMAGIGGECGKDFGMHGPEYADNAGLRVLEKCVQKHCCAQW
jgi:hypothetical protein